MVKYNLLKHYRKSIPVNIYCSNKHHEQNYMPTSKDEWESVIAEILLIMSKSQQTAITSIYIIGNYIFI